MFQLPWEVMFLFQCFCLGIPYRFYIYIPIYIILYYILYIYHTILYINTYINISIYVKSVLFYFSQENFIQSGHSVALLLHGPFLSPNDFWVFPKLLFTR